MDMRKLVGRNVKRVRQEKGLTQEQLAELSGFSQQYISGLEQGRRNPTIVSLYELATALGVSHMELVRLLGQHVSPTRSMANSDWQRDGKIVGHNCRAPPERSRHGV
jgi:transcriptional regulator with XRE-family HTH domain